MTLMRKGHNEPQPQPGDVWVSNDERSVYVVDQHGSNRRLKNKELITQVLDRFHQIKKEVADRAAARAAGLELPGDKPVTAVDPKTLLTAAAALTMGEQVAL